MSTDPNRGSQGAFPIAEVDGLAMAFGGEMKTLLPPYDTIPDEFKRFRLSNKWIKFQTDWFFSGFTDLDIKPKAGVDKDKAMRHLAAIQHSWEPPHEHKSAAVAYLASLWFDDVTYTIAKEEKVQ